MIEHLTCEQVSRVILGRFAIGNIRNGGVAKTSTLWLYYSEPRGRKGGEIRRRPQLWSGERLVGGSW